MDQGARVRADVLEDPCAQGRYPRRARLSQKRLVEALRASRRHSGLNDPKPFQRLKGSRSNACRAVCPSRFSPIPRLGERKRVYSPSSRKAKTINSAKGGEQRCLAIGV